MGQLGDSPSKHSDRARAPRWVFYTLEVAPVGTRGPFGPFTASDEEAANRIAISRATHSGLHVDRVERLEADANA